MGEALNALQKLHNLELKLVNLRRGREAKQRQADLWTKKLRQSQDRVKEQNRLIRETQMRLDALNLDIAARSDSINKHRNALTKSKTNKEYAAILTAMNTEKADNSKIENEALVLMEQVQKLRDDLVKIQAEEADLHKQIGVTEKAVAAFDAETKEELEDLQARRAELAAKLDPKAMATFNRVAQRNDGEALAAVEKAHPKRDEWMCAGCNMSVTLEVVNGLATRDEILTCAACGRILFLPSATTGGPVKARS